MERVPPYKFVLVLYTCIVKMSEYTKNLTARQLISYIANDYVELSHDKVLWQRDDFMKICREWLQNNTAEITGE